MATVVLARRRQLRVLSVSQHFGLVEEEKALTETYRSCADENDSESDKHRTSCAGYAISKTFK
jgi:hypothetical protein